MIFLGIDCGTQSTKTLALDWETGEILASAQRAYTFIPGLPPGAMEQHPQDWCAAAESTVQEVLSALGSRRREVKALGVSGQQHGLVALSASGEVVRPAKLWCDTSTTAQCEKITTHFGGTAEMIRRTGNAMLPGFTAPKILWLRENEPANYEAMASVLLPHDYLNFWLSGVRAMEYGDASGTALLDISTRTWASEVVDFIAPDLHTKLPPLRSSTQPSGTLRTALAEAWGLDGDVLIAAGGGDNMMGAIGTGNVAAGIVTASLGTSGTLYAFSEKPVSDPQGEVAGFCDSTDHWLPLVCTMNLTLVSEHVRQMFGWGYEEFNRILNTVPAGSDGLIFLPYLTGERTPNLPRAKGILHGMTLSNFTPAHLARAAVEGITLGLGYGLSRFRELGVTPSEIRLTGGGSNSHAWRQICADVFGVPVVCLRSGEGAGLGAAIQAGWSWHGACALPEICTRLIEVDESSRAQPITAHVARYAESLEESARLRTVLASSDFL